MIISHFVLCSACHLLNFLICHSEGDETALAAVDAALLTPTESAASKNEDTANNSKKANGTVSKVFLELEGVDAAVSAACKGLLRVLLQVIVLVVLLLCLQVKLFIVLHMYPLMICSR